MEFLLDEKVQQEITTYMKESVMVNLKHLKVTIRRVVKQRYSRNDDYLSAAQCHCPLIYKGRTRRNDCSVLER